MNYRYGFLGLIGLVALALGACSTSSGNSGLGNPLSGVTVVSYTPTASPAPTPTPTASPTPGPEATQAIADGGFESGAFGHGWTACSIPHVMPGSTAAPVAAVPTPQIGAAIVTAASSPFPVIASAPPQPPEVFAGNDAALTFSGTGAQTVYTNDGGATGPAGNNGICQTFTVPENASLSFEVYEGGSDTGLKYADQEADIVTASGTQTNLFFELNDTNYQSDSTPFDAWSAKGPYLLTAAPYNFTPGESVTLYIGSFDSEPEAKYGVFMFVDNVSVTGTTTAPAAKRRGTLPGPALRH